MLIKKKSNVVENRHLINTDISPLLSYVKQFVQADCMFGLKRISPQHSLLFPEVVNKKWHLCLKDFVEDVFDIMSTSIQGT